MKTKYRIWFWIRRLLYLYGFIWVLLWAINGPDADTIQAIAQIAVVIAMVIGQAILWIGGMMWFMSRTRESKILPGQEGSHTLKDYWGQPQIKKLTEEWVTLLKKPKSYRDMGGLPPKGVLLTGPPGYGKSFLALCLAGTAAIPFLSMDASSLVSVWLGMGSVKVMMLFRRARHLAKLYGACIVFMDELDAIGGSRGGVERPRWKPWLVPMYGVDWIIRNTVLPAVVPGMGNQQGAGLLNTLLYELDGRINSGGIYGWFYRMLKHKPLPQSDDVVFFMGATNVPDQLDPALTRAGRLNRRIPVGRPDWDGRKEINKGYLGQIKHNLTDVQVDELTDETGQLSPADIRQLVREEATRKAHFRGSHIVEMEDFQEAMSEVYVGLKNPFKKLSADERKALAVHEGGHAVLEWVLTTNRLQKVTILRYGDALGHVNPVPTEEVNLPSLRDHYHELVISLGGRAGEVLKHEPMSSTGGDYPAAMYQIQYLIERGVWGTPVGTEKENSIRVRRFYDCGLRDAQLLLLEHAELHDKIIDALIQRDELTHNEVAQLFGERPHMKLVIPEEPRDIVKSGDAGGHSSLCSSCG
jgi:ATP-dependent Zn protease